MTEPEYVVVLRINDDEVTVQLPNRTTTVRSGDVLKIDLTGDIGSDIPMNWMIHFARHGPTLRQLKDALDKLSKPED